MDAYLRIIRFFFPLMTAACVMVSSCGGKDGKPTHGDVPSLTVSVAPLAYFAKALGGDSLEVNVLMADGTDPETFQPGVGAMRSLRRSGAFAVTGVLPFERALTEGLGKEKAVAIYNMSEGVSLMYGTHEHGHETCEGHHDEELGEPDPHIWSSYRNARVIARNMLDALTELYPSHRRYYRNNYETLDRKLAALDSVAAIKLATAPAFLIWHPALSYFARDYGLRQVSVSSENKENSSRGLKRVLEDAGAASPRAFFVAPGTNSGAVKAVADETGLSPVEVDFMSADWEAHMGKIVATLNAEP